MNKTALSLIAFVSMPAFLQAATVTWGAQADSGFVYNGTTVVETGNYVRLGYLDAGVSLIDIQNNAFNLTFLEESFNQVDLAQVGFFDGQNFSAAGHIADSLTADTRPSGIAAALGGKQLVMWVLRSTDTTSIGTALTSLTHHAIFWAQTSTWTAPTDGDGAPLQTSIDLADLHQNGNASQISPVARIGVGTFPSAPVATVLGTSNHMVLAPIPEPTSAFLVAVGAAGLMMRRRRQS